MYAEIDSVLARGAFTAEELNGYKVRVRRRRSQRSGRTTGSRASWRRRRRCTATGGRFFREQERVQALTPDDLTKVLKSALVRGNRTVGVMVNPKRGATPEGGR